MLRRIHFSRRVRTLLETVVLDVERLCVVSRRDSPPTIPGLSFEVSQKGRID
jgi:hypothetical protein